MRELLTVENRLPRQLAYNKILIRTRIAPGLFTSRPFSSFPNRVMSWAIRLRTGSMRRDCSDLGLSVPQKSEVKSNFIDNYDENLERHQIALLLSNSGRNPFAINSFDDIFSHISV